jgi:putative ABC transport system ATP-binding protein
MPVPTTPPVLHITGLRKTVPGGRQLFDGLDLRLQPGEIVAVMGESGAGKSSLLNVIAGLDLPDAGTIAIHGRELSTLDDDARTVLRRDHIGFVFQAFHILPHLSLAQNVALPLVLAGQGGPAALARAQAMLDAVGLGGRGADYAAQLSGGELQRIAIARALVHQPALILADEPTGALDSKTSDDIMRLLTELNAQGMTVVIVTHETDIAAWAQRRLVFKDGSMVEDTAQPPREEQLQ